MPLVYSQAQLASDISFSESAKGACASAVKNKLERYPQAPVFVLRVVMTNGSYLISPPPKKLIVNAKCDHLTRKKNHFPYLELGWIQLHFNLSNLTSGAKQQLARIGHDFTRLLKIRDNMAECENNMAVVNIHYLFFYLLFTGWSV